MKFVVDLEKLRQYAAAGYSLTQVATKLGVSYFTVWHRARRAGIAFRRPARACTSEKLHQYAAAGYSIKEVEAELGVPYATLSLCAQRAGIAFQYPISSNPTIRKEMLALYQSGATLQQIGNRYGITREWVRQILTKYFRTNAKHGGAYASFQTRTTSRKARRDAECLGAYGCSFAQYQKLTKLNRTLREKGVPRLRTPFGAFITQRTNARRDGHAWKLTLWEWWTIWEKSGHWQDRGRGNGYWLTRRDKSGPFSVENVLIIPGNHRGAHRPDRPSIARAKAPEIRRLRSEGFGPTAISKRLNISKSSVYRCFARDASR